ncbi:hypothetical protein [Lacisediminimonas profundi]|uniref:hypothetical protein n=1 Tax=Lacisediminimonas profundi TaxID=2603856 RepID=UPI00124AE7C7|nr:hypothetical protein [Lacisediminimonas profundi]
MIGAEFGMPEFTQIIPADKSFFVLDVLYDDNGYPVAPIKYLVVAWALEEGTLAPYPVTLEGVQTASCYILQPDGAVERPGIDGFANIEDWLADQQSDHAFRTELQRPAVARAEQK